MANQGNKKYEYNRFGSKGARAGQAVYDIISKDQPIQTVEETIFSFGPDFVKELEVAIESGHKKYQYPFYVLVLSKKEMWAANLMRNYFVPRQTYPFGTDLVREYPNYVKTLYKVSREAVTVMWSVPGHQDCLSIARSPGSYDPELVNWIFQCYAGKFNVDIPEHKRS